MKRVQVVTNRCLGRGQLRTTIQPWLEQQSHLPGLYEMRVAEETGGNTCKSKEQKYKRTAGCWKGSLCRHFVWSAHIVCSITLRQPFRASEFLT